MFGARVIWCILGQTRPSHFHTSVPLKVLTMSEQRNDDNDPPLKEESSNWRPSMSGSIPYDESYNDPLYLIPEMRVSFPGFASTSS